jgi:hypothetical protein
VRGAFLSPKLPTFVQKLALTTLQVYVSNLKPPRQSSQICFHLLTQEDHLPAHLTIGQSLPVGLLIDSLLTCRLSLIRPLTLLPYPYNVVST